MLVVSLHVDDLIITGNNKDMILEFKKDMKKRDEMSNLGLLHYFMGIEIHQRKSGVFIHQKNYCEEILKKKLDS